jgi:hypothetical protein
MHQAVGQCVRSAARRDAAGLRWNFRYYFSNYSDCWYLSLFDGMSGICGEITPAYSILKEHDIEQMAMLLPDVKIIYILRDPIERAWSTYRKVCIRDGEALPDEESIIEFMKRPGLASRGDYLQNIARYQKFYPSHNILIGFYDAIRDQPRNLVAEVLGFIGADAGLIDEFCQLERIENRSPQLVIPKAVQEYLVSDLASDIEKLAEAFGGYCNRWREKWCGAAKIQGECRASIRLSPDHSVFD